MGCHESLRGVSKVRRQDRAVCPGEGDSYMRMFLLLVAIIVIALVAICHFSPDSSVCEFFSGLF